MLFSHTDIALYIYTIPYYLKKTVTLTLPIYLFYTQYYPKLYCIHILTLH